MHARFLKAIQDISASYWFIPIVMVLGATALALFTGYIDQTLPLETMRPYIWISSVGVDDARAILSLVAGSVIGVAGVSFSITVVAVSFATSNFGPRLISNFMKDRGNQFTLGSFIGVFVYCLITLTSLHGSSAQSSDLSIDAFVPHIGVGVSIVLAIACMGVLIYFIHHVADSINIENIIANIGRRLETQILSLFPGTDLTNNKPLERPFNDLLHKRDEARITASNSGYIQTLDLKKLLDEAIENHLLIRLHVRPGDYVCQKTVLMSVWEEQDASTHKFDSLRESFALGDQRTENQNVLFLIEQLTEVIARALSSGINDPYTAITCINWLRNMLLVYLNALSERGEAHSVSPYSRVQIPTLTLENLLEVIFDACEQHIAGDEKVALHSMAVLVECANHSPDTKTRSIIIQRFESLTKRALELLDRQAQIQIRQRHEQAIVTLNRSMLTNDAQEHVSSQNIPVSSHLNEAAPKGVETLQHALRSPLQGAMLTLDLMKEDLPDSAVSLDEIEAVIESLKTVQTLIDTKRPAD